ncbi:hypothetical protein JXR93_07145 [bacterium]|nr:hypothetical protein [bacterium]
MDNYHSDLHQIEDALSQEKYTKIILQLQETFYQTHITITEIDPMHKILYLYYFEYILTIPLTNGGTILDEIFKNREISESAYSVFKNRMFSIFKIKKISEENIFIEDLFDPKKSYLVQLLDSSGFRKGDLIQTFIYFRDNSYFLSDGALTHFRESFKYLEKRIKIIKQEDEKQKELFLRQAFRNYVNAYRYTAYSPQNIYEMNL